MREWEKNIRVVEPYVPGEQPNMEKMIKLNTNENPYPPAPGVLEAMKRFQYEKLRLYPDIVTHGLEKELSSYYGLQEEQIFVGVGSDDVLAMSFLTFFNSEKPILFPDITYSFYDVWANLYHIPFERPRLDENFRIRKEDYYKENGGVVIANPNAPTSICEDLDVIRDILDHNQDVIVIVDEAYVDFGGKSAMELIPEYDNLLVVQTFSKSRSMAGIRIGYAMGNAALIKALNDVKNSYNSYTMNQTSLELGVEAIKDVDYFKDTIQKVIDTRERTAVELEKLGFHFPKSCSNFLFAEHETIPAKEIFLTLREKQIFVRYFNAPRIDNRLRISIGTDEEMDTFLSEVKLMIENRQNN